VTAVAVCAVYLSNPLRGRAEDASAPPIATYLGFDRNIYPGDEAFLTLHKTFAFTSYWLGPPPNEKSTTWLGKREFLRKSGFGFLVLYLGRETREFKKAADGSSKGTADAQSAIDAARKEGFPANTIIFLDIEEGGRLPPSYHTYLRTWFDLLAKAGFRAGVYCSGIPAKESGGVTIITADDIRANAGGRPFEFFVYNDACPPSPGCTVGATAPSPSASGVGYSQIWQYAQSPRRKEFTASCPAGYHPNGGCYSPVDTSAKWDLDLDAALSADPSHGATP
jgi:glycoside hydrolase-like protein